MWKFLPWCWNRAITSAPDLLFVLRNAEVKRARFRRDPQIIMTRGPVIDLGRIVRRNSMLPHLSMLEVLRRSLRKRLSALQPFVRHALQSCRQDDNTADNCASSVSVAQPGDRGP